MKRVLLLIIGALVLTLLMSSIALAATPQDIYDDFADNGKLDGTYTEAELRAYLNDSTLHQYGDPNIVGKLDTEIKGRDTFPFTGFHLLIAIIVVAGLVGGGMGLRHLTNSRSF